MLLKTFKLKNEFISQYSVSIGKQVLFARSSHEDGSWFRIFGRGVSWTKNPLFGVRTGKKKSLKLKNYYITFI